jgi:hypothetical protein
LLEGLGIDVYGPIWCLVTACGHIKDSLEVKRKRVDQTTKRTRSPISTVGRLVAGNGTGASYSGRSPIGHSHPCDRYLDEEDGCTLAAAVYASSAVCFWEHVVELEPVHSPVPGVQLGIL